MAKLERTYNIPVRRGFINTPKYKRAKRAVNVVRDFLKKHMKCETVKLGDELNKALWSRGIKNPPHHIKVMAIKDEDVVKAELVGFEYKEAVKAQKKKEEGGTLKDKLAAKLGVKDAHEPNEEKKEAVTEEKKPSDKEDAKKDAAPEKKPAEKPAVKEKPKSSPKKEEKPTSQEEPSKPKKEN